MRNCHAAQSAHAGAHSLYASVDDLQALDTRQLVRDAETLLRGQITRTPEAELALVLLDRLDTTMRDLETERAARE